MTGADTLHRSHSHASLPPRWEWVQGVSSLPVQELWGSCLQCVIVYSLLCSRC